MLVLQLISKIAQREVSAAEVATAFCKRAAIAHQLTNCKLDLPGVVTQAESSAYVRLDRSSV